MRFLAVALTVARKDVRCELRGRELLPALAQFIVLALVIANFAFDLDLVSGPLLYRSLIAAPDPADRDPEEHAQAIVDMLWPGIRAAPRSGLQ